MSIDELLGMSVEDLEKLTDEELLERYKEIFILEPSIPLPEISEGDNEEDKDSAASPRITTPKTRKKREAKAKIANLKEQLMQASREGVAPSDTFDKLFDV
jgi:hypothetical protein